MRDFVSLASREALFLSIIWAIGILPASFLPRTYSRLSRLTIAPVLGLSTAVCVFTSVEWFIDGNQARFLVPVVVFLSLATGIGRFISEKSEAKKPAWTINRITSKLKIVLQVLLVFSAISFPAFWMMASMHSIGPTAYEVYDAPGYVAAADGAQVMSIGAALHSSPPVANFVVAHWVNQVQSNNRLDITPLAAAINALTGLHATQTWAAYLLAVLAAGGIALYGFICAAVRHHTWFAVFGGSLFGGAFFLQLLMDGSQAAIIGLALVVPLLVLIRENVHEPSIATLAVTALLLAGLVTVYPIFVLTITLTFLIYFVASVAARYRHQPRLLINSLAWGFGYVFLLAVLAGVFDFVATIRDIPGWISIIGGGGGAAGQPQYNLGFGVVSSWLLQTRDFYATAFGPQSPISDVIPALIIPLSLIVLVVNGFKRVRIVWIPALFVLISGLIAIKEVSSGSCSYCEDRTLLPIVPTLLFIIFTVCAALFCEITISRKLLIASALCAFFAFAGFSLSNEIDRFLSSGVFLPNTVREATAAIPSSKHPVELEGFGTATFPAVLAEESFAYEELLESTPNIESFLSDEQGQGVANGMGTAVSLVQSSFYPNYEYVLSRIPQVATNRKTIWIDNGVALERRASPLDVTLKSGLVSPSNPSDNSGVAGWVNGQLTFVVTGKMRYPERLQLVFLLPSASFTIAQSQPNHLQKHGVYLDACIPVLGNSSIGTATSSSIPVNVGIVLRAMTASYGFCP